MQAQLHVSFQRFARGTRADMTFSIPPDLLLFDADSPSALAEYLIARGLVGAHELPCRLEAAGAGRGGTDAGAAAPDAAASIRTTDPPRLGFLTDNWALNDLQ